MVTIAPTNIQIGRIYNSHGVLAHSNTYDINYGRISLHIDTTPTATPEALPTEAEVMAKMERGEELTAADRKTIQNRKTFRIYRDCRRGWSLIESVLGEVMMRRRVAKIGKENQHRMVGQKYRVRQEGGNNEWLYFNNNGEQI